MKAPLCFLTDRVLSVELALSCNSCEPANVHSLSASPCWFNSGHLNSDIRSPISSITSKKHTPHLKDAT